MDDARVVQRLQPAEQLPGNVHRGVRGNVAQHVARAVHQLERQIDQMIDAAGVEDAEEIRVIEARHQPRLGDREIGALAASGIFVTSITFTATSTSSS